MLAALFAIFPLIFLFMLLIGMVMKGDLLMLLVIGVIAGLGVSDFFLPSGMDRCWCYACSGSRCWAWLHGLTCAPIRSTIYSTTPCISKAAFI